MMGRIKNNLEIVLLYVTLLISLSVFKDELSRISFSLGYGTLTAANYLLYCVIGFSLCLYLYIIDFVFGETKIKKWKLWDYFTKIAFYSFDFILLTPILIILSIAIYKLINLFSHYSDQQAGLLMKALSTIFSAVALIIAVRISAIIRSDRKTKQQEQIQEQEIKELDNATKLLKDGYYSHSILESFKVLETHLFREITKRDLRVQRHDIDDLIAVALKGGIIDNDDLPSILEIRRMRHVAAHLDSDHTEIQAEFALNSLKGILKRNCNGTN
jgi:hypothetical protein